MRGKFSSSSDKPQIFQGLLRSHYCNNDNVHRHCLGTRRSTREQISTFLPPPPPPHLEGSQQITLFQTQWVIFLFYALWIEDGPYAILEHIPILLGHLLYSVGMDSESTRLAPLLAICDMTVKRTEQMTKTC